MWEYYLAYCEAGFRRRRDRRQLLQAGRLKAGSVNLEQFVNVPAKRPGSRTAMSGVFHFGVDRLAHLKQRPDRSHQIRTVLDQLLGSSLNQPVCKMFHVLDISMQHTGDAPVALRWPCRPPSLRPVYCAVPYDGVLLMQASNVWPIPLSAFHRTELLRNYCRPVCRHEPLRQVIRCENRWVLRAHVRRAAPPTADIRSGHLDSGSRKNAIE